MEEYHVLSKVDMVKIVVYALFVAIPLYRIFIKLGERDASPTYQKGKYEMTIPWIILCWFILELVLLVIKFNDFPSDFEPSPSSASIYREIIMRRDSYLVWGWANDYQLETLKSVGVVICSFCWTAYAFWYKKSDTKTWQKVCKFIAYAGLSMIIISFSFHYFSDLYLYTFLFLIIFILLKLAKVKSTNTDNQNKNIGQNDSTQINS